ncbi:MAG: aquaporin family protein [Bacteroidales bacterium]|nr:aquaporin family protein [Bacteroidales bacterium]
MTEYVAEFIGTMILIVFGSGVVAGTLVKNSKAENAGWMMVCVAWGLGVAFAVFAVGKISGAHINPAVTLGFAMAGEFSWAKVPGYILAQVAGAFSGAVIVWIQYYPHWKKTEDSSSKLGIFSTIPAERSFPNNLASEVIGTFMLLFGLSFLGVNNFADGLNPLVIGVYISAIGFSLGGTTGFAINPARDFGPRLAHFVLPIPGKGSSDWAYSWIPVVGPLIGGIYGTLFYQAVFNGSVSVWFWVFSLLTAFILIYSVIFNRKKQVTA